MLEVLCPPHASEGTYRGREFGLYVPMEPSRMLVSGAGDVEKAVVKLIIGERRRGRDPKLLGELAKLIEPEADAK